MPSDKNGLPLISIVMPAYNAEGYIATAIRSVLEQDYPNIELVIVNDASTDRTESVILGFQDSRIRYIASPKIGAPSGVRNKGLRACQGELIGFMDADDEFLPDGLCKLQAELAKHPEWMGAEGFSYHIDQHGNRLLGELIQEPDGHQRIPEHIQPWSVESILTLRTMNALPAFLMRREVLEQNGYFNEGLLGAEDFEFKIRMFLNGLTIGRIPEYIYNYRVYAMSVTKSTRYLELLQNNLTMMDWFIQQLDHPAAYQEAIFFGYAQRYYNIIRDQLNAGHTRHALHILNLAWQDERLPKLYKLKRFLPLYIRCGMPTGFNQQLVALKQRVRQNISGKPTPQLEPTP